MDKKKMKKIKFVCFKHFETAMMLKRIHISIEDIKYVPYYKLSVSEKGYMSLNIFNDAGSININKVKYVKLTVPKKVSESINFTKYTKNNEKIKFTDPEQKFQTVEGMVGIVISIDLFERMLLNQNRKNGNLSSLFHFTTTADSIKLLNKDKEFIAYLLPEMDYFN